MLLPEDIRRKKTLYTQTVNSENCRRSQCKLGIHIYIEYLIVKCTSFGFCLLLNQMALAFILGAVENKNKLPDDCS